MRTFLMLALCLYPLLAGAETPARLGGRNEFSVWGGASPNSPMVIGVSRDRNLTLLGLRYSRTLFSTAPIALKYTFDVIPAAVLSQPRNLNGDNIGGRELIYGAGFSPLGVQFNLFPRRRLQPFVSSSGGTVLFTRPAPFTDAARWNYMFEAGFGLQFFQRSGRAFVLGWKFHHISNHDRVPVNPGIDSNMIYTGFSFFR